jgi:hypothetical protein
MDGMDLVDRWVALAGEQARRIGADLAERTWPPSWTSWTSWPPTQTTPTP